MQSMVLQRICRGEKAAQLLVTWVRSSIGPFALTNEQPALHILSAQGPPPHLGEHP